MLTYLMSSNKSENTLCFITEFLNGTDIVYRFGDTPDKKYTSSVTINENIITVTVKNEKHERHITVEIEKLLDNVQITFNN